MVALNIDPTNIIVLIIGTPHKGYPANFGKLPPYTLNPKPYSLIPHSEPVSKPL